MLKKIIKCVFVLLSFLLTGCEILEPELGECSNCFLEIEAPSLSIDNNNYYHLQFNEGSLQTFTQLRAYVGYEMEYVGWTTDTSFDGCTWGHCEDVPIVNGSSYTLNDGYAYTMMGVYEQNIGDTATVWVGYLDNYGKQWIDSLKVIIK